ncbi:MAG TPA: protein-methionine-sulfoxide reductase catalytic subunit MsrP [Paracoccaceae bacterium]|nr:protein-methionine-sulfoxide reductase catalytic subunit MsrP [Paracoccaceae bacterium]
MHLHRRPRWALPERAATPEAVYLNRRALLAGLGAGGLVAALPRQAAAANRDPATAWTPSPDTAEAYADAGRAITPERINTTYNNFFEFGSHKGIAPAAEALPTDPWTISIDGLVARPFEIGVEDLLARMPIEERVYRHRCVEAWSMVVPWIGFPLAELVRLAEPTSDAKFVRMETLADEDTMPGLRQHWYPWPYTEGVTLAEATNPLAFMVVGAYGKVLHKPFGAPIRLHLPWKYGFKSLKSVVRISFTAERPVGFWEELQASEYGFWANVNPEVPHPRWSQADERVLGEDERIPTQLFNGYAEEVAGLYADMDRSGRTLWF